MTDPRMMFNMNRLWSLIFKWREGCYSSVSQRKEIESFINESIRAAVIESLERVRPPYNYSNGNWNVCVKYMEEVIGAELARIEEGK